MILFLVRDAMCALMPSTASLPGIADAGVDAFLERFRRESSPLIWLGVVSGSALFQLSPVFTVHVPLPAFVLSERLRDLHADRVAGHRIYLVRQSIFVVRLLAGLCWGADARVRQSLGLSAYPADPGSYRRV